VWYYGTTAFSIAIALFIYVNDVLINIPNKHLLNCYAFNR